MKPAKPQYTILKQICQYIPAHLVSKLARSFGCARDDRLRKVFFLLRFVVDSDLMFRNTTD
jgi:hypothetical protein